MFNLGTSEILVILVIGLVLFGNRLPGLARSLGKGLVEFKQVVSGVEDSPAR
jgi:sec-independent protein translocase protein TatA